VRLRAKRPSKLVGLTGVILLAAACSTGAGVAAGAGSTTSIPATSTHPLSSQPKPGSTHKSTSTSTSTSTPPATTPTSSLRPGTCPQRWGYDTRLTSLNRSAPRPGLSKTLVPDGSGSGSGSGPEYLTICRYAGLNQKVNVGALERHLVVAGSDLTTFVEYIDGPGFETVNPDTPYMCPMSTGQVDVLEFVYRSGSPVDVQVDVDGCPFVSNGYRTVWGGLIANRVTAWVGKDSLPT
jgi:hypothetical protein